MKKLTAIVKKELFFYLNNPIGYIVAVLFAGFANFLYVKDLFLRDNSSMRPFFDNLVWLLIIFISAVVMRVFAEERRLNTIEVLLSLPVSELVIVLGKFFALFIFIMLALSLTLSIPISLFFISQIAPAEILVAYFGIVMLSGAYLSISLFVSSYTKNQIVAFLVSLIVLFFYSLLSSDFVLSMVPSIFRQLIIPVSPVAHLQNFLKGLVDLRSVFYFFSTTAIFLFFTVISIERKK